MRGLDRVRRSAAAIGGARRRRYGGRGRGGEAGAGAAEAELDVLLEPLQLILEPTLLVLQFLDAAVGLPQFVFQPIDAHVDGRRRSAESAAAPGIVGGGSVACAVCGGASA